MGLDHAAAVFLCGAKKSGVDFSTTAMLGRQHLFPGVNTLREVIRVLGTPDDAVEMMASHTYAEPFFSMLGAKEVVAVDFSDYEKATYIHDMNLPIPDHLREFATVVYDGGTIEHIFNLPQVLKNCMEMVKPGGHFLSVTMANNFMGHGFWQFSPELMYRVFSPENGYQVEIVLLHEVVEGGGWYVAFDPAEVRGRGELSNSRPTYILTIAKRTAVVEIFATTPQQSDYVAVWEGASEVNYQPAPPTGWRRLILAPARAAWHRLIFPPAKHLWHRLVPTADRKKTYLKVTSTAKRLVPGFLRRTWAHQSREQYPSNSFRHVSADDVYHGKWA